MTDINTTAAAPETPPPPPHPMTVLGDAIMAALPGKIVGHTLVKNELVLTAARDSIVDVLTHLRDDPATKCQQLMDICGVDCPGEVERFEVVYNLLSLTHNHRIRVKVRTSENIPVPSVAGVYAAANWFERETYDLYGIYFSGHPDLRRILTDYGFDGHPLRKDFPMTGFVELRYDDAQKRVVYSPVELQQDFRTFDFVSPWEGMTDMQLPGDEKGTRPARGWTPANSDPFAGEKK